jgi:hypothetical protein
MKFIEVHSTIPQLLLANGWTDIKANKTDRIMFRGATYFKNATAIHRFPFCKLPIYYM